MIGYLSGRVIDCEKTTVVILTGESVGYEVHTPYSSWIVGELVELFVYTHMKENSLELFGFKSREEKRMFELLLSVNGVGPKLATGLLEQRSIGQIVEGVRLKHPESLKVNGVGLKTAEKIIIELRSKIDIFGNVGSTDNGVVMNEVSDKYTELNEVLIGFGYSQREILVATQGMDASKSLEILVKEALVNLKKK